MDFLIVIGLLVGLVADFYLVAAIINRWCLERSKAELAVFYEQLSEVRKLGTALEDNIFRNWPIWPRPVLFNTIDRRTQIDYARAEQILHTIELLAQKIRPLQEQLSKFRVFLNIRFNLAQITRYFNNFRLLITFRICLEELFQIQEKIQVNMRELVTIRDKVKQDINQFCAYLNENNSLPVLQKISDQNRVEKLKGSFNSAQACIEKALSTIEKPRSEDGIEFAVADLWRHTGEVYWLLYKYGLDASTYPLNFDLDDTSTLLSEAWLDIDLINRQNWHKSWKTMTIYKRQVLHLFAVAQKIDKANQEFEKEFQKFQQKIAILPSLDIKSIADRSVDNEQALSDYIGNQVEAPDEWKRILANPTLPSVRFAARKAFYENQVQSLMESIIKQSNIRSINQEIDSLILELRSIEEAIKQIQNETRKHQEAEGKVKNWLGSRGRITSATQCFDPFAGDSTDEIKNQAAFLRKQYDQYLKRAWGEKKRAKFILLVEELEKFEKACNALVEKHEQIILEYQKTARNQLMETRALLNTIKGLSQRTPALEYPWDDLFAPFGKNETLYRNTDANSYRALTHYIATTKQVQMTATVEKNKIIEKYNDFERTYAKTGKRITDLLRTLNGVIKDINEDWGVPLKEYLDEFYSMKKDNENLLKRWEQTKSLSTITLALRECTDIETDINYISEFMDTKGKNANEDLKKLNEWKQELVGKLENPSEYEIQENIIVEVKAPCNRLLGRAKNSPTLRGAIVYMRQALDIINRPHMINTYFEYIEGTKIVQGDQVLGTKNVGVSIGRIDGITDSTINIAGRDLNQSSPEDPFSEARSK